MDDSDVEIEEFTITEDDLLDELNPNRKRRKFTKDDAIYGVFAPDYGNYHDGKKKGKDYSQPVEFISGGISRKETTDTDINDDIVRNNDSNSEYDSNDDEMLLKSLEDKQDDNSESLTQSSKLKANRTRGTGGTFTDSKKSKQYKKVDKNFGSWQVHTTGFGQKYLEKFGFMKGQGLGKSNEGIAKPVEVIKRKGPGGLAYYGSERTESSKEEVSVYDADEEEKQQFREELQKWKKPDKAGTRRKKYVYKTINDIKAGTANKIGAELFSGSKVKVIDMTGPQSRILSGYEGIGGRPTKPDESSTLSKGTQDVNFSIPELHSNVSLLVDLAESDIIRADIKLKHEQNTIETMQQEHERLDKLLSVEQVTLEKLAEINNLLDRCEPEELSDSRQPLTLDDCSEIFRIFQEKFHDEYKMYGLVELAVAIVFPLIKDYLGGWMPLQDPVFSLKTFAEWKALLSDDPQVSSDTSGSSMSAFSRLIWETWLPVVRNAIMSNWSPRKPEPLIGLLSNWQELLPEWIKNYIFEQLVLIRLQHEIEIWNPLTDRIPIHSWLHPWLPLLADRLEHLFAPVRHKLGLALTNWYPSDQSARLIIQPWKGVFKDDVLDSFLCRSILPKLSACLAEFVINPHQQHLEPFLWVMDWKNLISRHHLVTLLERHFFPKWHQALKVWLTNKPNYKEVTRWYEGWKEMFGNELYALPSIKFQFNKGLDIMNQSISSTVARTQSKDRDNLAYFAAAERKKAAEAATKQSAAAVAKAKTESMTFKEIVEKQAENYGIVFMPIRNTRQDGKSLYCFGKLNIYFDRGVVYVQKTPTSYEIVTLSELVKLAK